MDLLYQVRLLLESCAVWSKSSAGRVAVSDPALSSEVSVYEQ
jgi:hypothetical protein